MLLPMQAKVVLPTHFTDNMVLQQKTTLRIKGKATPNKIVTVKPSWTKKTVTAQTDAEGKFCVTLQTPKAGGPYTLTFDDGEQTILHNVLLGEVWLCGGQSNMQMELEGDWAKVNNCKEEVANANYPNIRLLSIKHEKSLETYDNVRLEHGKWLECSPATAKTFTACGYFFARKLWQDLKVPIGVIEDCVGGTVAEFWTRREVLTSIKGFENDLELVKTLTNEKARIIANQFDSVALSVDKGSQYNEKWYMPDYNDLKWSTCQLPSYIENFAGGMDGSVWLRKHVQVPASYIGKDLVISLGHIDDANITYWNGVEIGNMKNFSKTATYTIPAALVKEDNVVCVRVFDTGGKGGFTDGPESQYLACDTSRISLAGEWRFHIGVHMNKVPCMRRPFDQISCLWNGMIAPLTDFPLRGVIWYQGESNQGRAEQYAPLFQALIHDWRAQFHQPELPFLFVQIANYRQHKDIEPNASWAFLREAQAKATCIDGVYMTSAIDIGDANDIHPGNKQEVGRRLALLALHHQYGKKVVCAAPLYKGYYIKGNEMHIQFSRPEGSEPFMQSDSLPGFVMAGVNQEWHVAKARTQGDEVIVTCDDVQHPYAVRYGWADNPSCTLHTKSNLPVFPFRTDL